MRRADRNLAISSKKSLWTLKKKLRPGSEIVHRHAPLDAMPDVFEAVGEGERQLLHRVAAGFADVVSADADGVEPGHVVGGEFDGVDDQAHGWMRREDVFVLGDVLFENIVLKGSAQRRGRGALFSAAAMYIAQMMAAGLLMVIEVVT